MWSITPEGLNRTFLFRNFGEAFAFMTRVAEIAETQQHHPDWRNVWNRVEITLCTHDQGNSITARDHQLAAAIDEVYEAYKA
ncbi:MAG: 4a-hydroxytetrahydrobiopterin dehydratase [Bacteroidia bacterium]|jgi:4a-hydroxytetrahydrobiopterin dehydratase|nr:4a-hydroxytetrahydrobiopterin dehydratase [Bacteroidia bacterium]